MKKTYANSMRYARRDLTNGEFAELEAIKERAARGMCTQDDLRRRAVLEPFQASATLVYSERTRRSAWKWRVDCGAVAFSDGTGPAGCFRNEAAAERVAAYASFCARHMAKAAR